MLSLPLLNFASVSHDLRVRLTIPMPQNSERRYCYRNKSAVGVGWHIGMLYVGDYVGRGNVIELPACPLITINQNRLFN